MSVYYPVKFTIKFSLLTLAWKLILIHLNNKDKLSLIFYFLMIIIIMKTKEMIFKKMGIGVVHFKLNPF